jgi:hypothetical protein
VDKRLHNDDEEVVVVVAGHGRRVGAIGRAGDDVACLASVSRASRAADDEVERQGFDVCGSRLAGKRLEE